MGMIEITRMMNIHGDQKWYRDIIIPIITLCKCKKLYLLQIAVKKACVFKLDGLKASQTNLTTKVSKIQGHKPMKKPVPLGTSFFSQFPPEQDQIERFIKWVLG